MRRCRDGEKPAEGTEPRPGDVLGKLGHMGSRLFRAGGKDGVEVEGTFFSGVPGGNGTLKCGRCKSKFRLDDEEVGWQ